MPPNTALGWICSWLSEAVTAPDTVGHSLGNVTSKLTLWSFFFYNTLEIVLLVFSKYESACLLYCKERKKAKATLDFTEITAVNLSVCISPHFLLYIWGERFILV